MVGKLDHMTMQMIDVPAGLNGVVAAETAIGAVNGDEGYFHYGEHDATTLARQRSFEDVWFLVRDGRLPTAAEAEAFRAEVARLALRPRSVAARRARGRSDLGDATRRSFGPCCRWRRVTIGLDPVIDIDVATRRDQALRVAAMTPSILAALHRVGVRTRARRTGHVARPHRVVPVRDARVCGRPPNTCGPSSST